jgi:chemotaxis protein histidine kinase CheA
MARTELLDLLASETERRSRTIIAGVEALAGSGATEPDRVESLRVQAHGLKGAALVVGQDRLASLAERIEVTLAARREGGRIDAELSAKLVTATRALQAGAEAAAGGAEEPSAVAGALEALAPPRGEGPV